jgi:hypothetical protein
MTVAWHWRQASNPHAWQATGICVERLYFSQQITHSVLGGLDAAGWSEEVLDFTGAAASMEAMVAMMVLASIIDAFWFVFGFVFVSGNCLSNFSLISISIFRLGKSEIEVIIEDMIEDIIML